MKIPATKPGLGAIEDMIAAGKNINVTLIFSLAALRARSSRPTCAGSSGSSPRAGDPRKVASVASFFVSRVDTEADRRLEEIGSKAALALRGKLAVANAKLAYQHYLEAFSGAALGVPRRQGRPAAALPVGLDLDEEPRLPRRDVRRGA